MFAALPLGHHDSALFDVALVRVVDGDTLRLQFRPYRVMPTEVLVATNVRLLNVWAPENETPAGKLSQEWVREWFIRHQHGRPLTTLYLEREYLFHLGVASGFKATLGRTIGTVSCPLCTAVLNRDIIAAGHATEKRGTP